MKSIVFTFLLVLMVLTCIDASAQETLAQYAQTCKSDLNFADSQMPSQIDCNTGFIFSPSKSSGDPTEDYVGFQRINSSVNMVFACRWMADGLSLGGTSFHKATTAVSVELIIHNTQTGHTCFFTAKPTQGSIDSSDTPIVPAVLTPPTSGSSLADTQWMQPADIDKANLNPGDPNASLQCAGCHVSGPYIASPRIVTYLTHYGLLNDGHDTGGQPNNRIYRAVGTTFAHWNQDFISNFNVASGSTCAAGCHSIGSNSTFEDLTAASRFQQLLIPSITTDIQIIEGTNPVINPLATFQDPISSGTYTMMPANDDELNPYRWVHLSGGFGNGIQTDEFETLSDLQISYSNLWCSNPTAVEAHVIPVKSGGEFGNSDFGANQIVFDNITSSTDKGTFVSNAFIDFVFSTNDPIPDRLRTFNLRDGLVCLNADQPNGRTCSDYQTRYFCGANNMGVGQWTPWFNTDSPSTDSMGDNESRSKVIANVVNICGGQPIGMVARTISSGISGSAFYAPNDRLREFDTNGLSCYNSDQEDQPGDDPAAVCSNYAVRFDCPKTVTLTNALTPKNSAPNLLTENGTQNGNNVMDQPLNLNPTWNSQQWLIQPIPGTGLVRLQNLGSGRYLNDSGLQEAATVQIYDLMPTWESEAWSIIPVVGTKNVVLTNFWSFKLLTDVDQSSFSRVFSQADQGWLSQQWIIQ